MPNPLITLSNATTVVADFNQILSSKNKVLFVVLGNTAAAAALANVAVKYASAWRYVVLVTPVGTLYPTLQELPVDAGCDPLPADPSTVSAIAIATDGTICQVLGDATEGDVVPSFMLAEAHQSK